jgi:hypothetical protein
MIMLARVIPYGGNAVRYALEKEKAKVVKANHMPEGIDPTAIWYMMKHHCQLHQQDRTVGRKLERFITTFVISPSKEESANFKMDDGVNLGDEALETLDSVGLIPKGMKKEVKTNFRNSMNVSGLHSDSKSGTLHLHLDCCRVDLDGNTNDVHDIHKRAMMATEIINMRYGWQQPLEIHDMRKEEIADFCEYTLQKMQEFDIDFYFKMLRMKGYDVTPRYDKSKQLVGYTISKNTSVFKASEIGRKFMVSQLEATWKKFHPKPAQVKVKPSTPTVTPSSRSVRPTAQIMISTQPKVQSRVQAKPVPSFTIFNIDTPIGSKAVEIPNSVKDIFLNEVQVPDGNDTAIVENVAHTAMLLFVDYIDAATSMSESCGGGGGSAPELDWTKKDDEDERQYARRCLQMAHSMCKPKSVKRGSHC